MPSSLANSCRPPSERSMIASFACADATPGAAEEPNPSGPRWSSWSASRGHVLLRRSSQPTTPQMPHTQKPQAA